MKTAVINFKVDPVVKAAAQKRAKKLGVSLSMVLSERLQDFALGKAIVMELPAEPMTPKMEKLFEQAQREIAAGETYGPFDTAEETIESLHHNSSEKLNLTSDES